MKNLKIFKLSFAAFTALLLSSCAMNQPSNKRYTASELSGPSLGMGIVFGKRCEGGLFSVSNIKTGEETVYTGTYPDKVSVFAMQLPVGEYTIRQISTGAYRPMVSSDPVRFIVTDGQIVYVGTLIKSWSIYNGSVFNKVPEEYRCDAERQHIVDRKLYHVPPSSLWLGLKSDTTKDWAPVYISNYVEGVLPELRREYPRLDLSKYVTNLMH
ncbi:hypothetical protein [Paraburkholderia susongensis]|uniref:DUF2846 domain-containing protein n=1 Tax=Paraburkholderia susongensis TaxID=1515439 RepID=A0A1X7M2H4_9BURK|nr:hypothetical protein [Paraburkholderia susongensis]SMG59733.1 hypothetical protein SAMN06265784_11413 [Paraburkholderia susongensis]